MVTVKMNTSALRAKAIYDRLMAIPRTDGMSNNEWAKKACVNTSFFTNLRKGSEPSVGNLRAILKVVNISIPEFFLSEAQGRVVERPARDFLEAAIRAVMPGLPRNPDKRVSYLVEAVANALALQPDHISNVVETNFREKAETRKADEAHQTTNPSVSSLPRTG